MNLHVYLAKKSIDVCNIYDGIQLPFYFVANKNEIYFKLLLSIFLLDDFADNRYFNYSRARCTATSRSSVVTASWKYIGFGVKQLWWLNFQFCFCYKNVLCLKGCMKICFEKTGRCFGNVLGKLFVEHSLCNLFRNSLNNEKFNGEYIF